MRFLRWLYHRLDASLRARVLLPTTVLFAGTLAAMGYAAVSLYGVEMERAQHDRMELYSRVVTAGIFSVLVAGDPNNITPLLEMGTLHRRDVEVLSVVTADGRIAYSSSPGFVGVVAWPQVKKLDRATFAPLGSGVEVLLQPIPVTDSCGTCHGPGAEVRTWLELRFTHRAAANARRTLASTLLVSALPALLLLLAIAYWLLGREAVGPIRRLVAAMRRAETGDRAVRADEGRPDEVGEAARRFDLTLLALHRSQDTLKAAHQAGMVRADRLASIGELATGLAHEIKNPLAGISGALELLAEDLAADPRQLAMITEMRHQVLRVARTMESMLSFARPPKAQLKPTDVNATIEKILFLVGQQRHEARIEIRSELDRTLPPVLGDPALLEQVFLNLALNAVQAMATSGGSLVVRSFLADGLIGVELRDSGPGIVPEVQRELFKPFFTTKRNGNGLGLAISARILEEQGGQIDFRCPADGGTTFVVRLRRAPPAEEQAA